MTLLLALYWVMVGAVALSVPPAIYVIGCCAVDAFAYDPWLDGPRPSDLATDRSSRRANNGLDSPA